MEAYKKLPIRNQKFFNIRAGIIILLLQIIAIVIFVNKDKNIEIDLFKSPDFSTYTSTETPKVSVTPLKDTSSIKEKGVAKPVRYVQNQNVVEKVVVPVIKTIKVTKVVPVKTKKSVSRKSKIEFVQMNSIPAVSVSFSKINYDHYLALDTFIKENEIIAEAIEVIDSVEITTNDTITEDSIYYVMETNTIAKNEESKIETTITNPNAKIVPIKWNGKKIWTKPDTTKKIVADKKILIVTQKQDTNKIDLHPKGTWSLYKNENTENATTQTGSQRETTYGSYKILLPGTIDQGVNNNLEDPGYQTDIPPNQKMKETIYCPPPIFDKWHWQENDSFFLLYEEFRE